MQSGKLTSRLTTLALAIATSACAPRASLAQAPADASPPVAPVAPSEPAAPVETSAATGAATAAGAPTTQSKEDRRRADEMRRRADEARRAQDASLRQNELGKAQANLARTYADLAKRDMGMKTVWAMSRVTSPDTPAVISTAPMERTAATEWTEDLKVMDKVIREEVARAGGDDPQAMGIKLTMLGRAAPMYVEGAGVIFSAGVNFPLAPIGATSGQNDERPRDPASKWERAKRELSGYSRHNEVRIAASKDGKAEEVAELTFDQGKLDRLMEVLIKVLPEANNIRHLKESESVFVTITGMDEGAMPVRLTLKASKADIDAAADGKITEEEFAKRVVQRVG